MMRRVLTVAANAICLSVFLVMIAWTLVEVMSA